MSDLVLPILLLVLILYASIKKVNVYNCFTSGAKKSFDLVLGIFPYIAGIMICVMLFRLCGFCEFLIKIVSPIFNFLGIPSEVCELVLLRPFSGSGSLSVVSDIISTYGADSYISRCACCIMGSSETVFYVSSVYFSGSKIKNITPAICVALFGNLLSAILCCLFCKIM